MAVAEQSKGELMHQLLEATDEFMSNWKREAQNNKGVASATPKMERTISMLKKWVLQQLRNETGSNKDLSDQEEQHWADPELLKDGFIDWNLKQVDAPPRKTANDHWTRAAQESDRYRRQAELGREWAKKYNSTYRNR